MLKDKNGIEYSKDDMVKFLDISNVSKSPLKDVKDLRHLENGFGINSAVDFKDMGVIDSREELTKRSMFEKFALADLGVEGFITKYLGF